MKKIAPYILMVPQFILSLIFIIGIFSGIIQSFGIIPVFGLYKPTLKYYFDIFQRSVSFEALFYSLKIASISAILSVIIGILICYILINTEKIKLFLFL